MKALAILALLCGMATASPKHVVVASTSIEILDPIRFVGATATIAPTSKKMLDAIAATLDGNPNILLVEVRAFGTDAPTDKWILGARRARAVIGELVRRGVAARRLQPGGAARPDPGDPGPGPEFVILKRTN